MRGMRLTRVVFPEPVGPDREAGARRNVKIDVVQHGGAVIGEIQLPEFNVADKLGVGHNFRRIGNFGLLRHEFVNTAQGCGAALKNIDDPSKCNDRPGQLDHVRIECHKIADAHRTIQVQGGRRAQKRLQVNTRLAIDHFPAADP